MLEYSLSNLGPEYSDEAGRHAFLVRRINRILFPDATRPSACIFKSAAGYNVVREVMPKFEEQATSTIVLTIEDPSNRMLSAMGQHTEEVSQYLRHMVRRAVFVIASPDTPQQENHAAVQMLLKQDDVSDDQPSEPLMKGVLGYTAFDQMAERGGLYQTSWRLQAGRAVLRLINCFIDIQANTLPNGPPPYFYP